MKAFLTWLLTASAVSTVAATPLSRRDTGTTHFFTFGNSYSETRFKPGGRPPSASNPMGNPKLGTGTTAGGPNWVGYLTTAQNASLVLSYDLAIGGATIDDSLVKSSQGDLVSQVNTFQSTYSDKTKPVPWTAENAVFAIWIGINDVAYAYSNTTAETFTPKLAARYRSLVEQIYRDGGRKFLFLNVPATSRNPFILGKGEKEAKAHAKYLSVFNDKVESMVKGFTDNHKDATTVLYDSWSFMTKVLDSPQKYGFPDATCVNKDGSSCIWWNDNHPSAKYHQLQAKDMKAHLKPLGAW